MRHENFGKVSRLKIYHFSDFASTIFAYEYLQPAAKYSFRQKVFAYTPPIEHTCPYTAIYHYFIYTFHSFTCNSTSTREQATHARAGDYLFNLPTKRTLIRTKKELGKTG